MRSSPRKIGIYERRRHRFGDMPPLSHWPDKHRHFQGTNSEVCRWLATIEPNVPPLKLMELVRDAQAIVYDQATALWSGCFYQSGTVKPAGKASGASTTTDGESLGSPTAAALDAPLPTAATGPHQDPCEAEGQGDGTSGNKLKLRQRDMRQIAESKVGRDFLLASGAVDEAWFTAYRISR